MFTCILEYMVVRGAMDGGELLWAPTDRAFQARTGRVVPIVRIPISGVNPETLAKDPWKSTLVLLPSPIKPWDLLSTSSPPLPEKLLELSKMS